MAVAVAALCSVGMVGAIGVEAAVVPNPVTDLRVTPTDPVIGGSVRTEIDFCVPDATASGDTFSVQLPAQFDRVPGGFQLRDPDGLVVATASVAGDPPVATFTFNEYVDVRTGVCGLAFFESRLSDDVDAGVDETLTYVVNGTVEIERVVTPREPTSGVGRTRARKGSFFDDPSDQCRNDVTNCIGWAVESRPGPFLEVVIEDDALDGATFDCTTLTRQLRRVDANGQMGGSLPLDPANVDVTCAADSFRVAFTDVPADALARVTIRATPADVDPDGGTEFVNRAVVVHTNIDESVDRDEITSRRRNATAGGEASGVVPPSTTAPPTTAPPTTAPPTTAPVTTAPPTTAPATTAPPTTVGSGGGVTTTSAADTTTTSLVASGAVTTPTTNTVDVDQPLPATGSGSSLRVGTFALLTLLAGGALVVAAARRRPAT